MVSGAWPPATSAGAPDGPAALPTRRLRDAIGDAAEPRSVWGSLSSWAVREKTATLALVLALGLPIAAGAVLGFREVQGGLLQLALLRRESVATLTARIVLERFARMTEVAESLATRVRMRELVAEGRWEEAMAILASHDANGLYERMFLADPEGVLHSDHPPLPGVRGESFAHRDWYRGVTQRGQAYVSEIYERQAEPRIAVLAVTSPVRHFGSGELVGILVLQVAADSLAAWAREVDLGEEAGVWIVDPAGTVVAAAGALELEAETVARLRAAGTGAERMVPAAGGEEQLAAHAAVGALGWSVISQQPLRAALAPHRATLNLLIAAWVMLIAATLLVATWAARERERWRTSSRKLSEVNQELSAFTYSVSHDLRAPLRAIDGFARMIRDDSGPRLDAEAQRRLGVILSNVELMEKLIEGLLVLSRAGRQALEWTRVDMQELVRETLTALSQSTDVSTVELRVHPLPPATGDRALLRQLLFNLVSNAVKFSRGRTPAVVEVSAHDEAGSVVYSVSDNGVGFDMEDANRLFRVFERLHSRSEFEGAGVGLAIVERIVRRHGGRVWVDARPDQGATFHFTLGTRQVA